MAKQIIGAEVQVEFQSVGNLRKAIKEANSELIKTQQAFGAASKEAIEAAKRVNNLKDAIKDANEVADLFDPGNRFKAVGNAVSALANGFTAVQGALGLLGIQSKEVEQQLLRVQSALALSQGLSGILDSGKDFARLASIIKNQVVAAFSTLRGAIAATGIGALVLGVSALILNFDKLKKSLFGVNTDLDDNLIKTRAITEALEAESKVFDRKLELLKAQGVGEKELTRLKIEETKKRLAATQAEFKAQQAVLDELFNTIGKEQGFLSTLRTTGGGAVADILGFFGLGEGGEELVTAQTNVKNLTNTIDELGIQIKILEEEGKKTGRTITTKNPIVKGGVVERVFPNIDLLTDPEEVNGIVKSVSEGVLNLTEQISGIATNPELESLRRKLLLTPEQQDLLNLQDYYNKQFEIVKGNQVLELELAEQFEQQKTAITKSYNEQRLAIVSGILGQAANLLGKQTAAGKALAIAEATINTYLGATQVLRSPSVVPEPFGTALKVAQVGIIIANGIKSVREITRTKVPGGAGSSVPSISTGAPLQAQLSPQVQAQALNANAINNLSQQPTRAYILDRDIQNQNQVNAFITRNANI